MTAEHQQEQQQQYRSSKLNDTVLIVGAGIAGIIPALLLEKADIPYDIYERTAKVSGTKSGSALYYNTTTAWVLKQVGIYDELYDQVKNTALSKSRAIKELNTKWILRTNKSCSGRWGTSFRDPCCMTSSVASGSDKKLTMGDLINWTPKELSPRLCWKKGLRDLASRPCCLDWRCLPQALANRIYALPEHRTRVDTDQAFKAYRDERLPWVEAAFNSSTMMKSVVQKGLKATLMPFFVKKYSRLDLTKDSDQDTLLPTPAAFLPLIENQGTVESAF
ncbi:hypothetical protein K457DRAFT_18811 [Linnemannia elongata AG-77]|uniref:FAD-binding domain-containing protein n=1 Tax=Linnemannia elongata AG-77 TaxID=1314771 RepID=A0A197JZU3_9FUNG|nr:hypothetical protein K457DRAFT_18811 [Linnemannia elongata AG-77]